MAEHDLRRDLGERDANRFRDVRHRAARPGIRLEDIDHVALNRELEVHQTDDMEGLAEPARNRPDVFEDGLRQRLGRQDAGRVPGVDAGLLDVFLDASDEDVSSVSHDVHVDFGRMGQVSVDKDRMVL